MHLGRLMGALGRFLRTLGRFWLDLGRILLTFWVVWASKMGSWALGVSGTDLGGPRTPIWEDLASILSKLFHFIRFHAHHSISFQPHSIPFYSIPFYPFHSIPFPFQSTHSVPFISIPFHSCLRTFSLPSILASRRQSASAGFAKRKQSARPLGQGVLNPRRHSLPYQEGLPSRISPDWPRASRRGGLGVRKNRLKNPFKFCIFF